MEDITDADYTHVKKVFKDFEIKKIGRYYGLYVQSNTLLLVNVFENFRNMCLQLYEFDLRKRVSYCIRISMASSLKKAEVKLDLLTDINMLLIVKKVSEVKYSMLFINMRKLITNS